MQTVITQATTLRKKSISIGTVIKKPGLPIINPGYANF